MTGSLMFLRYAFPCALTQLTKGVIDKKEYELLERWAMDRRYKLSPIIEILIKGFPEAVERLTALSIIKKRDIWSLENVLDFWRNCHNYKSEDCNIKIGRVKNINGEVIEMSDGAKTINAYGLLLEFNTQVYIHQRVIIEVI